MWLKQYINNFCHRPAMYFLEFILRRNNKYYPFRFDGFVYVVAPLHCEYIARLLSHYLTNYGVKCKIINGRPKYGFDHGLHIVICPQLYKQLPDNYVVFQVEQTIHDRWFTPEYFKILSLAHSIFDYSIENIEFLRAKVDVNLYHFPISFIPNYGKNLNEHSKTIDVLFYGDPKNDRRKKFLQTLRKYHSITVVEGLYGEDIKKTILSSKIVINIHFYENALLETTRIFESLSLSALVISEKSADQHRYQSLTEIVDFVEIGDAEEMAKKISHWLKSDDLRVDKVNENIEKLNNFYCTINNPFSNFMKFIKNS